MASDPKPAVTAYPEPDKLGPLGGPAATPGGGIDLRRSIVDEFRASVDRARGAAADVQARPTSAVHDYRKALRRARAVLALIDDLLPRAERVAIRDVLRDARRAVSAARDHDVAPDAFARLALDDGDRATRDAILAAARDAAPALDEIARVLAGGAAGAAAQAEALDTALPAELGWDAIGDGLAATYREARRHLGRSRKRPARFHAWRRRTRELTYQLELVAGHAGPRAAAIRDRFEALSQELGKVVDLFMVRELIDTHGVGLDRDRLAALTARVDDQIDDAVRATRRDGKAAYHRGGRRFARRVVKACRKDRARPEPATTAQA